MFITSHKVILTGLGAFAALYSSHAAPNFEAGVVHAITADNFQDALKLFDVSMVKYHTPNCGHCKNLAPLYADAAKQLKDKKVGMFEINCADFPDFCHAHEIKGYPTLKSFFKDETYEEFENHDGPMIVDYLTRLTFPPVSHVKDITELKNMMEHNVDTKFVGLFKQSSDEFKIFNDFAHKYRSKALFLSADFPEAFKELGVDGSSGVVCLKSFDDKKVLMKKPLTAENLSNFVHIESLPMLGQIDDSNFTRYIDANLPIVFIFYVKGEDRDSITTEIKRISEKYHGRFSFAFIDGFKYSGHAESLGLKADVYPSVAVQDFNSLKKFPMGEHQGEVKASTLDTFLLSILDGSAKPYYVSGPVPAANDGAVKIIVHDNFKNLVLDDEKDALIEMYTTWCHSCKRFGPLYEQLAEAFMKSSQDKLVIGKMDLEANDQPSELNLKINTIPAVFLFPANKKMSPIRYQGDYSLSSLKAFVLENATHKHEVLPEDEMPDASDPLIAVEDHEEL